MSSEQTTLYDRVGGEAAVNEMVEAFYALVLGDPELRGFFDGISVEKLVRMQKAFFAAALDGPASETEPDLGRIHHGLGIRRKHVTMFVNHLITVLDKRHAIDRRDAMDIVFRIATYSDQVLGESGGTDG